jgi:hypothetical protein
LFILFGKRLIMRSGEGTRRLVEDYEVAWPLLAVAGQPHVIMALWRRRGRSERREFSHVRGETQTLS